MCSFGGGFATNTQLFVEGMFFGVPIKGTVLVNGGHGGGGDGFVSVCVYGDTLSQPYSWWL